MRLDRVLLIQENARNRPHETFRECFCLQRAFKANGIESDVWGRGHLNYHDLPHWRDYDLIINLEQRAHLYGDWIPNLSEAKTIKFLWAIDAHSLGTWRFDREFERGDYHLLLHSTKKLVQGRLNRHWFPNAWDDQLMGVRNIEKSVDVGFVGDVSNRAAWIDLLKSQSFSFQHDFMVHGEEMVQRLNSYRLCWNRNFSFDLNYRNFEVIGTGGVLLSNQNPQYDDLGFVHGLNYYAYSTPKSLLNTINELLARPTAHLEKVSQEALKLSRQHTYTARVARLIEEVGWKF